MGNDLLNALADIAKFFDEDGVSGAAKTARDAIAEIERLRAALLKAARRLSMLGLHVPTAQIETAKEWTDEAYTDLKGGDNAG